MPRSGQEGRLLPIVEHVTFVFGRRRLVVMASHASTVVESQLSVLTLLMLA
jgi:hypothetical protein